jgi:hypothetical protein
MNWALALLRDEAETQDLRERVDARMRQSRLRVNALSGTIDFSRRDLLRVARGGRDENSSHLASDTGRFGSRRRSLRR